MLSNSAKSLDRPRAGGSPRLKPVRTYGLASELNPINQTVHIDDDICLRCGGVMVLRDGRYGMFMGCINYPRCKYAKKVG